MRPSLPGFSSLPDGRRVSPICCGTNTHAPVGCELTRCWQLGRQQYGSTATPPLGVRAARFKLGGYNINFAWRAVGRGGLPHCRGPCAVRRVKSHHFSQDVTCDTANRDGWTGFYSGGPLNVSLHGRAHAHPLIADYGLDRSGLWDKINPDAYSSAWCAVQGEEPSNWGARAYVLRPESKCFPPASKADCPEWCAAWKCDGAEWCNGKRVLPEPCYPCSAPLWSPPAVPHRLAHDFDQFRPMGSTIRFTVDLHRVGCGAVLTLYLAGLPAVDSSFQFYEQQPEDKAHSIPGCAGQMYYADANPEMTGCRCARCSRQDDLYLSPSLACIFATT